MVNKTNKSVKQTLSPVAQQLNDDISKSNAKRSIGIPMPSVGGSASVDSTQIIRVTKLGKQMAMRGNVLPGQCQVICSLISQLESVEGEGCMVKDLANAFLTWADTPAANTKGKNSSQDLHKVFNSHWASKMLGNKAWETDKHTSVTQQLCGSDMLAVVEYA